MRENLNCGFTYATFRIWGRTLDARSVTALLNAKPSVAFQAGDVGGPTGRWHRGYWALSSRDALSSSDLQTHIAWLLDQLEPVQAELAGLLRGVGISADVVCYWESSTGQGGPVFDADFLQRFCAFHLDLGISFFDGSPREPEGI